MVFGPHWTPLVLTCIRASLFVSDSFTLEVCLALRTLAQPGLSVLVVAVSRLRFTLLVAGFSAVGSSPSMRRSFRVGAFLMVFGMVKPGSSTPASSFCHSRISLLPQNTAHPGFLESRLWGHILGVNPSLCLSITFE